MEDRVFDRVPEQRAPQELIEGVAQAAGTCGSGRCGFEHAAGVAAISGQEGEQEDRRGTGEGARGEYPNSRRGRLWVAGRRCS